MDAMLPPFQMLLNDHGDDVHRFLVAMVGPDEADDCFQDTFIAALRGYPGLRDGSNLRGWLLTIAHRKAIDAHRARRRRPKPIGDVPDRAAVGGERSDDGLWTLVRTLPPKQRAAVAHRFVADLPYAQIAQVMRTTQDAARRNVHEGVRKLREAMRT
jgi:RNA polymerase sigma factor (sigma-70 family)